MPLKYVIGRNSPSLLPGTTCILKLGNIPFQPNAYRLQRFPSIETYFSDEVSVSCPPSIHHSYCRTTPLRTLRGWYPRRRLLSERTRPTMRRRWDLVRVPENPGVCRHVRKPVNDIHIPSSMELPCRTKTRASSPPLERGQEDGLDDKSMSRERIRYLDQPCTSLSTIPVRRALQLGHR